MTRPIAALYVESDGHYYGLDGVDPWDIRRDASSTTCAGCGTA